MTDQKRTEHLSFGPVELEITDADRSVAFWRDVIGMRVRSSAESIALGTETETLVILHPVATSPAVKGHAGLYHLAIHVPDEGEFARILARFNEKRHYASAIDHIMSKALYLSDPDGLGIEITLEMPERVREFRTYRGGVELIDAEGRTRQFSETLDVGAVLAALPDDDISRPLASGTRIGHVHMHVGNLEAASAYYAKIGFIPHLSLPSFGFADLGAGGDYPHRIGLNIWQGLYVEPAPAGTARMRRFEIRFSEPNGMAKSLEKTSAYAIEGMENARQDPFGNQMVLTATG
ncbi:VOC family protein [Nisaea sp.]